MRFFSAQRLFRVLSKATKAWAKTKKKMDKVKLYFQLRKKTSIHLLLQYMMSDEESQSVRKRMWKITSGGIALKRAI